MKLILQRVLGVFLMLLSFFMLLSKADVRNPEFIWMLMICGIVFVLIPKNLFE